MSTELDAVVGELLRRLGKPSLIAKLSGDEELSAAQATTLKNLQAEYNAKTISNNEALSRIQSNFSTVVIRSRMLVMEQRCRSDTHPAWNQAFNAMGCND